MIELCISTYAKVDY